jgi:hypothetical protein
MDRTAQLFKQTGNETFVEKTPMATRSIAPPTVVSA